MLYEWLSIFLYGIEVLAHDKEISGLKYTLCGSVYVILLLRYFKVADWED